MAGVDPENFDLLDPQVMEEIFVVIQEFDAEAGLTHDDAQFMNQRIKISGKTKADNRRKGVSKKDGRNKYELKAEKARNALELREQMEKLEVETIEAKERLLQEAIQREAQEKQLQRKGTLAESPPAHGGRSTALENEDLFEEMKNTYQQTGVRASIMSGWNKFKDRWSYKENHFDPKQ